MTGPIQVYTTRDSPALRYVLSFIFDSFYGCGCNVVSEKSALNLEAPAINYSTDDIPGALQVIPTGYLFEDDLRAYPPIEIKLWQDLPCFFETSGKLIPFDLFGAVFFLLSRAEEYKKKEKDIHGRFLASHSVMNPSGITSRPIVDEWLMAFQVHIQNQFPQFTPVPRTFQWINTFDIDVAYAYRHRGLVRWLGASLKDLIALNFSNLICRIRVHFQGSADPFDTYAYQVEIAKGAETKYFFLLGNRSRHDKNLSHGNTGIQALIKKLSERAEIGIHPSYASNNSPGILRKEIDRLRNILGRNVKISRQHYLKLTIPQTYRNLIKAGITEDYSMGFVDRPGFRSGTSTPHSFFDLEKQEHTDLKIVPLAVMEVTLQDYMGLSAKDAIDEYMNLIERVKSVNGTFVTLWHNESLSETGKWKGWRKVYEAMIGLAREGFERPVQD